MHGDIYQFDMPLTNGQQQRLDEFKGQVLLIVNTASQCGFTPQYEGLQTLFDTYRDHGFQVLAFPCDQFAHQEPGKDDEIAEFCSLNFNISFPLFKKSDVNGEKTSKLFQYLKAQAPGMLGSKSIKWNFTKFLVNRQGQVVKRYAPNVKPQSIADDIEKLLKE